LLDGSQLLLQPSDMGGNPLHDLRLACLALPVALSRNHLHQLPPACDEFGQGFRLFVRHGSRLWAHPLSKQGDDASIELICFGELPCCPREISDVPRVHHGNWQTRARERRGDLHLEATSCLEHDKGNWKGRQMCR